MDYIEAFRNLNTYSKTGKESPHKAILLLAVIELFETNVLTDNEIKYNELLKAKFAEIWQRALPDEIVFTPSPYLPFWFLSSDGFWHLIPVRGKESTLSTMKAERIKPSETKVHELIQYAHLDEDLYFLMTMSSGRSALKRALLETYSTLSETQINEWCEPVNNVIDYSISALHEYNLLTQENNITETQFQSGLASSQAEYNKLNDDIQIVINFHYYLYLKSNRYQRSIFRGIFPDVYSLVNRIIHNDFSKQNIPDSFIITIEQFLKDLRASLMNENGSLSFIESIDNVLQHINDIEVNESSILDDDLFDEDDKIIENDNTREKNENPAPEPQDSHESIAVERSSESVTAHSVIEEYNPVDFYVENDGRKGVVYDLEGNKLYSEDGQLTVLRGKIYRFNYKPMCLTVKGIKRCESGWEKSGKLLVPYSNSELYRRLDPHGFIDEIEDFIEADDYRDNKILFSGVWYDFDGYEIKGYVPESIYAGNTTEGEDNNESASESIIPAISYKRLLGLESKAEDANDYLWAVALFSILENREQDLVITFDELACMMIACAFELHNKHPEIRKVDKEMAECIDFLIQDSGEYMEEELTVDSPRSNVFAMLQDYPMGGDTEDFIEELISKAPYNMLKIWFDGLSKEEIIMSSVNKLNSCLYSIHPKKFESSIHINPAWRVELYMNGDLLRERFEQDYVNFFTQKSSTEDLSENKIPPAISKYLENVSATVRKTIEAHYSGLDTEKIAQTRQLSTGTIVQHLCEGIKEGLIPVKAVLPVSRYNIIEEAYYKCGPNATRKDIYDMLEGNVDYSEISLFLAGNN